MELVVSRARSCYLFIVALPVENVDERTALFLAHICRGIVEAQAADFSVGRGTKSVGYRFLAIAGFPSAKDGKRSDEEIEGLLSEAAMRSGRSCPTRWVFFVAVLGWLVTSAQERGCQ